MEQPFLSIRDIVKDYRNHRALDGVSIDIPKGCIFGLLGPNGAGKTSLIRIINQIAAADQGQILFEGQELRPSHAESIGYLPEERGLYKKMKVGEQALYLAQLKGLSSREAHKRLGDWFDRFSMSDWWDRKVEDLSKGMAQKIQFITTVVHRPPLLILDEPFSGFDPINMELIREEILELRNQGTTVIFSTHNMGSVEEVCDNIALINKSRKVLDGDIEKIKQEYSEAEYDILFKGNIIGFTNALWTNFQLVYKEEEADGLTRARVRLMGNSTLNQLLKVILPEVEVHGVKEVVPTIHDIFIKVVNEQQEIHE